MNIKNVKDKLPYKGEYPKRKLSDITHIDIHHSGTKKENDEGFKTIKQFAYYHINGHDWPGIGYHYIIDTCGQVYKTGYAREIRWSVGGNNSYSISVMLIGDFTEDELEEDQYNNALELVKKIMKAYDIPKENVLGHQEFPEQNTECPGFDMDKFRGEL